MAKFGICGNYDQATGQKASRAYAAGRKASVAGALITTNPHLPSGSTSWVAWRNGWVTYQAGQANTYRDGPSNPAVFASPTVTMANVTADTTGATWGATPSGLGLPVRVDWGDGDYTDNPANSTAQLTHKYAASGVYATRLVFGPTAWNPQSVTVTIV